MELLPGADLEARAAQRRAALARGEARRRWSRSVAASPTRTSAGSSTATSSRATSACSTTARAKIMDFGIAKIGGTHLTKTGMMVGTVHYMSPEQVRGQPLDGRSDVFSMGVILYEAAQPGTRPFAGESATQVLYKIVQRGTGPAVARQRRPGGPAARGGPRPRHRQRPGCALPDGGRVRRRPARRAAGAAARRRAAACRGLRGARGGSPAAARGQAGRRGRGDCALWSPATRSSSRRGACCARSCASSAARPNRPAR